MKTIKQKKYQTTYKGYITYGKTHFEAIKKMLLLVHMKTLQLTNK